MLTEVLHILRNGGELNVEALALRFSVSEISVRRCIRDARDLLARDELRRINAKLMEESKWTL